LDFCDGEVKKTQDFQGPIDLGEGILSRDGWWFHDDSAIPVFDDSTFPWAVARVKSEGNIKKTAQDWYFFAYGLNYKQALQDFVNLSGKIPMLPKFAYGYWYSRYWAYSAEELKEIAEECELHSIPLEVLVLDMDWHVAEKKE